MVKIFSNDLIGDSIMQLPALNELAKNQQVKMVFPEKSLSEVVFRGSGFEWEYGSPDNCIRLDCGVAMAYGCRTRSHMAQGFAAQLNLSSVEWNTKLSYDGDGSGDQKYLICARHSTSCTGNDPKIGKPNKSFSNSVWIEIGKIAEQKGLVPLAVGSEKDAEDEKFSEWPWEKMYGRPLMEFCSMLEQHRYSCISIDTGIKFLANSLGCDVLTISCALSSSLIGIESQYPMQTSINLDRPIDLTFDSISEQIEDFLNLTT